MQREETHSIDKDIGIDIARAAACAMVVLLHVAATYFYSFGPLWVPALVFDSFTRSCVPVFFMISGALLLWKDEPIAIFYRKRALRVLPPLITWTVVYVYLYGDLSIGVTDLVIKYLMMPYGHLWYFYVILGLYLSSPFLGKILRNSTDGEVKIFLLLWFFIACILNSVKVLINKSWSPPTFLGAELFSGYIGFFVAGAILARKQIARSLRSRCLWLLVFALASACICILTYKYSVYLDKPNEAFYVYQTPLVAIAGSALFMVLISFRTIPRPISNVVRLVSNCSLGVYCLHPIVISFYLNRTGIFGVIDSSWLKIPFIWLSVIVTTLLAVYIIRLVPRFRIIA